MCLLFRKSGVLIGVVALLGCRSPLRLSGPAISDATSVTGAPVVVFLMGFFDNERLDRFVPLPIDYSHMIDSGEFYSALRHRLASVKLALIDPGNVLHIDVAANPSDDHTRQIRLSLYNAW